MKEPHMSWWAVSWNLWVFDLVPDIPEYRKWRKQTKIQRCERNAKRLKITNTCEVVPRIEESKHNRQLRLPCTRQMTTRIENLKLIQGVHGLLICELVWLKLDSPEMGEYMYLFHTKYCYFCKLCFVLFLNIDFFFFAYLMVRSHLSSPWLVNLISKWSVNWM